MKEKNKIILIVSIGFLVLFGFLYEDARERQEKRHRKIEKKINNAIDYITNPLDSLAAQKRREKSGNVVLKYKSKYVYLAPDTNRYNVLKKYLYEENTQKINELIKAGDLIAVPNRTKAKLISDNFDYKEIRILEGKYTGIIAFALPDAIWYE